MGTLANQPSDWIRWWVCVCCLRVCMHIHVSRCTNAWKHFDYCANTCEQTGSAVWAARLCSCPLSPLWPVDSRENRICQIRAAADEEKHRSMSHTSSQPIRKQACPGNKDSNRAARQCWTRVCTHKQQRAEQFRGKRTPTLTQAGCWIASGWRVCTYVCVRVVFPWPLSAFSLLGPLAMYASVHVCVWASGGSGSLLTRRHRMRQIRVWLVPSFLNSTKPGLIPGQTHCLWGEGGGDGGRKESNLWSVCPSERKKKKSEGWMDWWRKREGLKESVERDWSIEWRGGKNEV